MSEAGDRESRRPKRTESARSRGARAGKNGARTQGSDATEPRSRTNPAAPPRSRVAARRALAKPDRSTGKSPAPRTKAARRPAPRVSAPEPPRPKNRVKAGRANVQNTEREPKPTLGQRASRLRARFHAGMQRARGPLVLIGKLFLVALAVVGLGAVGKLAERHVRTSPAFATRTITVTGNERLAEAEILAAAGLMLGQNVFESPPEDAQARLLRHPWVAEARVLRRLPGTFHVEVREHQAAALIWLDRLYLIGDDATIFKSVGPGDPVDLPVVTGVDVRRFTRDRAHRSSLLLEVVAVLHDYRAAGLFRREPIAEIHVEPDDALSLYVGEDATEVRLGRGPYRSKLRKLRTVLDRLEAREARPAYVYLDNVRRPDRVTVRLRGSDVAVQ